MGDHLKALKLTRRRTPLEVFNYLWGFARWKLNYCSYYDKGYIRSKMLGIVS